MNFGYMLFAHPELKILEKFCDEFITLCEIIFNLENDELQFIEKNYEDALSDKMLNKDSFFAKMSENEIKLYFLAKKRDVVEQIPKKYSESSKVIEKIKKLVNSHPNEVKKLNLYFKSMSIMEIYCNYIYTVDILKEIKFNLEVNERKNK